MNKLNIQICILQLLLKLAVPKIPNVTSKKSIDFVDWLRHMRCIRNLNKILLKTHIYDIEHDHLNEPQLRGTHSHIVNV